MFLFTSIGGILINNYLLEYISITEWCFISLHTHILSSGLIIAGIDKNTKDCKQY